MKSTNKLKNYLETYTRKKYFTDRVAKIRKEIGIPKNGITFPISSTGTVIEDLSDMFFGIKYKNVTYRTYPKKRTSVYSELLKPVPQIYQKLMMEKFFNIFILYNERHYEVFEQLYGGARNTVALIESRIEFLEREGCCDCETRIYENYMDHESAVYPVMIGISPYATQNEALDLIKKRWGYIQNHIIKLAKDGNILPFDNEKKQLSQIRERKTKSKEIEDVVYENKSLSINKLLEIVRISTGVVLDPGEIGKIRSLAIKSREKLRK